MKIYNSTTALQTSVGNSFTPGDQVLRSDMSCNAGGDIDFGSGNPMLLPDSENSSYPYMGVSGDKEGGIWFMDRTSPGGYGGGTTCTAGSNNNIQTVSIIGGTVGIGGPLIHNNPAYWESSETSQAATSYIFLGSHAKKNVVEAGAIMRYQICNAGYPISLNIANNCSPTGAYAYEVSGTPLSFPWGSTPTVSAASASETDAIVWAIWADGSVVPNASPLTYKGQPLPAATNGRLYAFDAASSATGMPKLYSSNDCSIGGQLQDQINPATKYSVPTVANGYVYLGTQGPLLTSQQCSDPSASCFNNGTFYIFGHFNSARTCT